MRNKLTVKIPTPDAQGADSWIMWKRLTYGGRKELFAEYIELKDITAQEAFILEYAFENIKEWNWVDAQGEPIPPPKTRDDIVDYTDEEVSELYTIAYKSILGKLVIKDGELKN